MKTPSTSAMRVIDRNHGGMHPRLYSLAIAFADGQKLDPVTEVPGKIYVQAGDLADPFGMDILEFDAGSEAEGEQEGELVRGIDPLDVEGRVRFGIAEFLCLFQDLREIRRVLGHPGEDIVAGAVQDAEHGEEAVGGEVPPDGGEHRDAAAHRRLIEHLDPFLCRRRIDLPAMERQTAPCWR